jgi:integrase
MWDSEVVGLMLRVHAKGAKSFAFDYRHAGKSKRVNIGRWPAWSAVEARRRATELRKLVDSGQDPAGERRERREAATIRDLIERYRRDHEPKLKLQRPKENQRMLDEIEYLLGRDTPVHALHHGDLEEMHRKITVGYVRKDGVVKAPRKVRANRVLALASVMLNMSLRPLPHENRAWRSPVDGNPCRHVTKNREDTSVGRLYTPTEMARIADAVSTYEGRVTADCVRLVMMSGCRPAEAQRATWDQFDREPGYWRKPASTTKQKKEHRIPLAPPALALIERLRANRAEGQTAVFPGKGPGGTVATLHNIWRHVREHAGIGNGRIYDLRHSFASLGAGGGLSLPVIGRLLGHATPRSTSRYAAHLSDDPLQAAVNLVVDRITGAPDNAGGDDNVVSIGRRP